ncbi:MAG: hypothetical protein ACOVRM_14595, partial [Planctomycetaceae bacterium]
ITATGTDLSVSLNQAGGTLNGNAATAVADFSGTNLTIPTGGDSPVVLDYDTALLQASGTLNLTVSSFLHVEGGIAISRTESSVKLDEDTQSTSVDLLTIGASDVSAFAGVNAGTQDAMGLQLAGVNVAIVVATSSEDSSRQWVAAKATASSVSFVGVDGLTLSASDLAVELNQPDQDG